MAKDSLTEGNIPHSPCIVCLEHFDETSSFRRTICYHYFHNRCLHKYLEHVRAQQAEEEADDARRDIHQKDGTNKEKEIICPLCRCPLDKESLTVHCVDSDEEDREAFVPSPALRAQQQEMALRFEQQKAKGGIIDLEWEKNKYLINSDDRTLVRVFPTIPTSTNEGLKDVNEAKGDHYPNDNGEKDTDSSKQSSPHAITFHGRGSDDRRPHQAYRRREHRDQGRTSREFRDRHRNVHSSREFEKYSRPTDRYNNMPHVSHSRSYNSDKELVAEGKACADVTKRSEEESEAVTVDANDRLCIRQEDGCRVGDRRETRSRGSRRGRGRFRDGFTCEYGDDHGVWRGDRMPSADSEFCHPNSGIRGGNYLPREQNTAAKFNKNSHYHNDDRKDYRQEHRDQRPRRRGQGEGGGFGGRSSYHDADHYGSTFRGNRQSATNKQDSYQHDDRFDKGRSQRRRPQRGHYHSYTSKEDSYRYHGERNLSKQEREATGSKNSDKRRTNTQRRNTHPDGTIEAGGDLEPDDNENDSDGDMRNFEINQRWRSLNYSSLKCQGDSKTVPRKFVVIDDNENSGDEHVVRGEEVVSAESDDEETVSRANPNYTGMNGQLDHYYPGFDQGLGEESWEDEINPYATEVRRYRGSELEKYHDHNKSQDDHFAQKLKERVQNENMVDEELRRVRKEQEERRRNYDVRDYEEPQSNQSGRGGMSIVEQFKQKQQRDTIPDVKDHHPYKQENSLDKEMVVTSAAATSVSTSTERSHSERQQESSHEETHAEICDEPFTLGEDQEEKVTTHRVTSVNDIKWRGHKKKSFYPPDPLCVEDQCQPNNGMNGDVYDDAWERRSALDKKSRQERKKKNRKDQSDPKENSSVYKETSYHSRHYDKRDHHRNVSNDVQKRPSEKSNDVQKRSSEKSNDVQKRSSEKSNDVQKRPSEKGIHRKFQGGNKGSYEENLTNNRTINETCHQIPPSQHESFKKPKPLDMRKSNPCQSFHSTKKSAEYANKDDYMGKDENEKHDSQTVHTSKASSFKKPKPIDFRKETWSKDKFSHKSSQEATKDAPS